MRERGAAFGHHRHFFPVFGAAPYGRVDVARMRDRHAPYQGNIGAAETAVGELRGQSAMRGVVRGHHKPGCCPYPADARCRAARRRRCPKAYRRNAPATR